MTTYSQVEQALTNLGYAIDFNLRYHAKLMGYIPVEGYESEIILEFREAICSELGDREELLEVEWLMDDGESCLVLDRKSLDSEDDEPDALAIETLVYIIDFF